MELMEAVKSLAQARIDQIKEGSNESKLKRIEVKEAKWAFPPEGAEPLVALNEVGQVAPSRDADFVWNYTPVASTEYVIRPTGS